MPSSQVSRLQTGKQHPQAGRSVYRNNVRWRDSCRASLLPAACRAGEERGEWRCFRTVADLHWGRSNFQCLCEFIIVPPPFGLLLLAPWLPPKGFSPRISPFTDVRDVGSLLSTAGFTLLTVVSCGVAPEGPSWEAERACRLAQSLCRPKADALRCPSQDVDEVTIGYPSIYEVMDDVRGMGESNAAAQRTHYLPREVMAAAGAIYEGTISSTTRPCHPLRPPAPATCPCHLPRPPFLWMVWEAARAVTFICCDAQVVPRVS